LSVVRTFRDPDDYTAAFQATKAEVTITGRGLFAAKLTRIQLHHLWMQRYSETLPRIAHAAHVSDRAIISFCTEPGPSLLWDGVEMQPNCIIRHGEGESAFQRSVGPASFASMSLPIALMVSAGATIRGCNLTPPRDMLAVMPSPAAMARLQRLHAAVSTLAEDAPDILTNPEAARGAEQSLVEAMVACLSEKETRADSAAQRHHAMIIRRFRRLLEDNPNQPHYIPELCAALGVSDRLLRVCCKEHLGMGPHRYLLLRRMHLARRALRAGTLGETNVTKIATRYGFFELGRFAVEYKSLFAESPSASLAREST
jgi:AraC-like DNA-binding protein